MSRRVVVMARFALQESQGVVQCRPQPVPVNEPRDEGIGPGEQFTGDRRVDCGSVIAFHLDNLAANS